MTAGRVTLVPFDPQDDNEVREILREAPMEGEIRLSLEREPQSTISLGVEGHPHHFFLARDARNGRLLGFCSRAIKRVWWQGEERQIGYLGQLRTRTGFRPRLHHWVKGFRACDETRQPEELPFDFTAILEDNHRARRLLERGLPGLPTYERWCELETLSIRVRSRRKKNRTSLTLRRGTPDLLPLIGQFLRQVLSRFNLAPVWSTENLCRSHTTPELQPECFRLAFRGEVLVGCLALWDQRSFKQTRIRGYGPRLLWGRPWLNLWSSWTGGPHLPPVGDMFHSAYLSHFALLEDEPSVMTALVDSILDSVSDTDLEALVIALPARHPLLPFIKRRYSAYCLRSLIYWVHPTTSTFEGSELPGEPYLEAATL